LADSNNPGMDKVYFYIRKAKACLLKSKDEIDKHVNKDVLGTVNGYNRSGRVANLLQALHSDDDFITLPESNVEEAKEMDDDDYKLKVSDLMVKRFVDRTNIKNQDWMKAGWFLSPVKEIQEDCRKNSDGLDRLQVDALLAKLFKENPSFWEHPQFKNKEWNMLLIEFWDQWEDFNTRKGLYFGRDYVWESTDISEGRPHIFHKKFVLPFAPILGMLGVRVCSKILGIGAAERCWGSVKHLKNDKRAHLSGDKVKKQATIFGATCIERAQLKKKRSLFSSDKSNDSDLPVVWDDEDFDDTMEAFGYEHTVPKQPKRVFKAWFEDWEAEIVNKRNDLHEHKLLAKYGGMVWKDPDSNYKLFTADSKFMMWQRKKKGVSEGYNICGIREDYDPTKPEDDPYNQDKCEPWSIQDAGAPIYDLITAFYMENPSKDIEIVSKPTTTQKEA
jgi:hypothetical protein